MTRPLQLVVFSDLDGSLLDHDTYAWDEARVAVEALKRHAIPLVLVTSKTRAELVALRAALGNHHPYVVENGAASIIPRGYFAEPGPDGTTDPEQVISGGPARSQLHTVLDRVRKRGSFRFLSFHELGAAGIAEATGLGLDAAADANERAASEPLLWQDSDSRLDEFAAMLTETGLHCVRGGRFVHVMGQHDKGKAVARLARLFGDKFAGAQLKTVAIGDGPNDLTMLAEADIAVVIRGKHKHAMPLEQTARVIRPSLPGPAGWREAVLELLCEYVAVI